MTKQERIRLARERADKAAAALVAFDKAASERAAASKAFHARWTAFLKRSRVVMANLAGEYVQKALAEFHAELASIRPTPKGAKAVAAAIEAGAKIGGSGYGSSYSLSGLAPRLRLLSREQVRTVAKAEAKMNRAKTALSRATSEWRDTKRAAFEAGEKMGKADVVAALVKREGIRLDHVELPDGLPDLSSWRRDELARKAEQAGIHLTAARQGTECECDTCKAERHQAQERAEQIVHIKELPRQKIACPVHGPVLMHVGHRREFLRPALIAGDFTEREPAIAARLAELGLIDRWIENLPVGYCPKGDWHSVLLLRRLVVETEALQKKAATMARAKAKADKIQARALARASAKGAALPPPVAGDEIAFKCPGCGELNERADVWLADDEDPESDLLVSCGNCGSEMLATGVARIALEEGAKAA